MALTREELKKVDEEIQTLNDNLIKALQDIGIEHLDLYSYINMYNKLEIRKNKIQYLLATTLE